MDAQRVRIFQKGGLRVVLSQVFARPWAPSVAVEKSLPETCATYQMPFLDPVTAEEVAKPR
jgi:hypothetical protein